MPYEIPIRSTNTPQQIVSSMRGKLARFFETSVRTSNSYRGSNYTLRNPQSPHFLAEDLCVILPKYMSSNKHELMCNYLAEHYSNRILQHFFDICKEKIEPRHIGIDSIQTFHNIFANSGARRVYIMTPDITNVDPNMYIRKIPEGVTSDSHIVTCNPPSHSPIIVSYSPPTYEEAEEPHMLVVQSHITLELTTSFRQSEYIRIPCQTQ